MTTTNDALTPKSKNSNEKSGTKRSYQMSKRAKTTAETARSIFRATSELWQEHSFVDITLEAIAERADVSVRTVIRRYGSKEGLFEAAIQNNASDVTSDRENAEVGNIKSAIEHLLNDYETYGDAAIRTLALEDHIDAAKKMLQAGRAYHRDWCARVFSPFLPSADSPEYEQSLTAYIAATELYLWKLMRRDLGKSKEETYETFFKLVSAITPEKS